MRPSADPREHYWKLYTGQLILIDENVKRKILSGQPWLFDAELIGKELVGNLEGTFGESAKHGQAPPLTIYRLSNPRQVTVVSNPEVDHLRELTTYEDVLRKVPLDVAAKYPRAVLNVVREKYLPIINHQRAERMVSMANKIMDDTTMPILPFWFVLFDPQQFSELMQILFSIDGRREYIDNSLIHLIPRATAVPCCLVIDSNYRKTLNCCGDIPDEPDGAKKRLCVLNVGGNVAIAIFEFLFNTNNKPFIRKMIGEERLDAIDVSFDEYFEEKDIERMLGTFSSHELTQLYDDHAAEILDRLLQLFARKPLEVRLMPSAPKKKKGRSPVKTAKKSVAKTLFSEEEEEESMSDIIDDILVDQDISRFQVITPSSGQTINEGDIEYLTAVEDALLAHPNIAIDFAHDVLDVIVDYGANNLPPDNEETNQIERDARQIQNRIQDLLESRIQRRELSKRNHPRKQKSSPNHPLNLSMLSVEEMMPRSLPGSHRRQTTMLHISRQFFN